jgi:hypothetical protein
VKKKINKRDLIKKLVVEPKFQKRMFWAKEMKLLNDLMSIFEDLDFWEKKSAKGLLIIKKKFREFSYKIPEKVTITLGKKEGEDKKIFKKTKTIRQFIDE